MGYKNANAILPQNLLRAIQRYIDGEYIYIPRQDVKKRAWGANTDTRQRLEARNRDIVGKYTAGRSVCSLAKEYFLSDKAIYKIINEAKKG